jgi:hypothetical protein
VRLILVTSNPPTIDPSNYSEALLPQNVASFGKEAHDAYLPKALRIFNSFSPDLLAGDFREEPFVKFSPSYSAL